MANRWVRGQTLNERSWDGGGRKNECQAQDKPHGSLFGRAIEKSQ